jgi:S1-C subfamily serine protease
MTPSQADTRLTIRERSTSMQNRRLSLYLTALLAAFFLNWQVSYAQELKSEDLYQKSLPSISTLTVEKKDGSRVLGTAFLALKDGIAVTAWHVVKDAKKVVAKFSSGEEFNASGLIDKDETRDTALIRIKVFGRPLLSLCSTEPSVGVKAYVIGSPKGLDFTISDGLVSQIQTIEGVKNYQFSCAASPGNSGGPLLNDKGEVLGVVSWQLREGQNLNFAVPSTYVLGLDATLPTQPWEQVTAEQTSAQAGRTEEETDRLLADAWIARADGSTAIAYTRELLKAPVYKDIKYPVLTDQWLAGETKRKWNLPVVPSVLYSSADLIRSLLDRLATVGTADYRERVAANSISLLRALSESTAYLTQAIEKCDQDRGWSSEAKSLLSRSEASEQEATNVQPVSPEDLQKLLASKAFADRLPVDFAHSIGTQRDQTGFPLGVSIFWRTPLWIVGVQKDGLADSLGFRFGDTIISADGHGFATLQDVKLFMKSNLGKKTKFDVQRDGKRQTITVRIPDELPRQ